MDYFGPMVNRSARVMSQALGGQIMASSDAIREIQATLGERYDENSPSLPHVETLKRMGIEIVNIGERSLKGLEAPEDLSLVLPTSLLGRLEAPTAPVPEASSRIHFNIDQLKELNVLTLRLEALATSRIFEPARPGTQPLLASAPSNDRSSVPNALGPKAAVLRANLDVVLSNFKADAPDHDLMLLLDQITGRIENSLSTLYLRTMMHGSDRTRSRAGPPPHLEDIDPRILREAVRLVQNLLLPATTR
jgi:adenylate cyclase